MCGLSQSTPVPEDDKLGHLDQSHQQRRRATMVRRTSLATLAVTFTRLPRFGGSIVVSAGAMQVPTAHIPSPCA